MLVICDCLGGRTKWFIDVITDVAGLMDSQKKSIGGQRSIIFLTCLRLFVSSRGREKKGSNDENGHRCTTQNQQPTPSQSLPPIFFSSPSYHSVSMRALILVFQQPKLYHRYGIPTSMMMY